MNESGKGSGDAGDLSAKKGRRLRWFSGVLSPEEAATGMNAAGRNAERLARDAKRMLESGSFATAAALAILAVEESGKVSILRGLSSASNEKQRRNLWKDYRSHTSKNTGWILPELAAKGARTLEELRPATDRDGEHAFTLDNLKQLSLYTDCLGTGHWAEPERIVDRALAQALVATADVLARSKTVTPEEMEMWNKHMAPVQGGSLETMKGALRNWYVEMRQAGLWDGDMATVEAFIFGGEA